MPSSDKKVYSQKSKDSLKLYLPVKQFEQTDVLSIIHNFMQ